jgi:hypothetical protein
MSFYRLSIPLMLGLCGLITVATPALAVERVVLGEEFTNTG